MKTVVVALALASTTLAHVQINYPKGEWDHTEEAQESGAFCGGGTRSSSAPAWGLADAFISLSGDEGHSITVRWTTTNSADNAPSVTNASSFDTVLLANATFPSSGNFCFNVSVPNASSLQTGARGTLYVESSDLDGDDEDDGHSHGNVSSCADTTVVPSLSVAGQVAQSEDGQAIINPATNQPVTYYEYYCSNSTILALDTCECHCHDDHEHCSDECSTDRVSQAAARCAAAAAGSSLSPSPSSTAASSGTAVPVSTNTSTSPSPSATTAPSGAGASINRVSVLGAVGMVALGAVMLL